MIAVIITLITSALEIIDQLFGSHWSTYQGGIEVALALITPVLVWLVPRIEWVRDFPE
jgi:hypothetical protein